MGATINAHGLCLCLFERLHRREQVRKGLFRACGCSALIPRRTAGINHLTLGVFNVGGLVFLDVTCYGRLDSGLRLAVRDFVQELSVFEEPQTDYHKS